MDSELSSIWNNVNKNKKIKLECFGSTNIYIHCICDKIGVASSSKKYNNLSRSTINEILIILNKERNAMILIQWIYIMMVYTIKNKDIY